MPRTTDKPSLAIVGSQAAGIQPPRPLGQHGAAFWARVMAEFAIADVGGIEILAQLCAGIDRAEALAEIIAREGEVIRTRTGVLKSHPAVRDEISARQFVLKAISKLGIDLEHGDRLSAPARPPQGQQEPHHQNQHASASEGFCDFATVPEGRSWDGSES